MLDDDLQLLAGTAWLFARKDLEGLLDALLVDEAGQVALADALAVAPSLVCAPRLLDPDCKKVADTQFVDAVCRFVELASRSNES
jgi:hypothetical protein